MIKYNNILEILDVDNATYLDVIKNKTNYYYSYPIRKRNGNKRYIDAPFGLIKKWQNIILKRILYNYGAHPIAYGFVKGKNPILAAQQHVGADILVSLDIKNFFNSIKTPNLLNLFEYLGRQKPIWYAESNVIMNSLDKELVEVLTYRGVVPQGAPSSPALSNLYMLRPDKLLKELALATDATISRYADDIVFSATGDNSLPTRVISPTKAILRKYNLRLNPKKIHINRKNKRMRVVGIVVNEKINIPRETWRNFRAKLHNLKIAQTPITELKAQKLRGQIEWYKTINPQRGEQFLAEFGQLNFLSTSNILTPIKI